MKVEKIAISSHERILFVNLYDICYCQSENSSLTIYLIDGAKFTVVKPLIKLQSQLSDFFIRVAQCTIINSLHLESIEKKGKKLIMKGNKEIPFTMPVGKLVNRIGKISTDKIHKFSGVDTSENAWQE
jgi:DNA-binding LytR/AlgR family response regulator